MRRIFFISVIKDLYPERGKAILRDADQQA